jgi:hypothetical protein
MRVRDTQPMLPMHGRLVPHQQFNNLPVLQGHSRQMGLESSTSSLLDLQLLQQQFPYVMPLQQNLNISTEPVIDNFALSGGATALYRQGSLGERSGALFPTQPYPTIGITTITDHLRAALEAVELPLQHISGSALPPMPYAALAGPRESPSVAGAANLAPSSATPLSTVFPACMACPSDQALMSEHQAFLRLQIEFFRATDEDINAHVRGRNRPIRYNQIGVRCRHCAHIPPSQRRNGSTYFPASTLGLYVDSECSPSGPVPALTHSPIEHFSTCRYQAAQNMGTMHIQCGKCPEMSEEINQEFIQLIPTKNRTSNVGRSYWSDRAKDLGLVDTEDGIFFIGDV